MIKRLLPYLCFSIMLSDTAHPVGQAQSYQDGKSFAGGKNQNTIGQVRSIDLKTIPQFESSSPEAAKYYTQGHSLGADSVHLHTDAGDFVKMSKGERQHFHLSPETDPLIKNAENILKSEEGEGAQEEHEEVEETLHECLESHAPQESSCHQTLAIKTRIVKGGLRYVYRCADTYCNGRRNNGCACKTWIRVIPGHDCIAVNERNQCIDAGKRKDGGRPHMWPGIGTPPPDEYDPDRTLIDSEAWVDSCQALENLSDEGKCAYASKRCTQGPSTRTINGVSIHRSCWQYTFIYLCGGEHKDACKPLKDKGCFQVDSKCHDQAPYGCKTYQQTYKCLNSKKTKTKRVKGKFNAFCAQGECADRTYSPNGELFEVVSKLQILQEMQKDLTAQPLSVFKGQDRKCSKHTLSFSDCCGLGGGWGESLKMTSCSAEEQDLTKRREKGQCHQIGTYCAEKEQITGICLRKKTSFCCFGSKLVRAFQEQGRAQLGIGWGSGEQPSCRGLTVEELSKVDFTKIDTREVFSEIAARYKPNKQQLQSKTLQSLEANMKQIHQGLKDGL